MAFFIGTIGDLSSTLPQRGLGVVLCALAFAGSALLARARTAGLGLLAASGGVVVVAAFAFSAADLALSVVPLALALAAFVPLVVRFLRGRASGAGLERLPSASTALAVYACVVTAATPVVQVFDDGTIHRADVDTTIRRVLPGFEPCFQGELWRGAELELFIAPDGRVTRARAHASSDMARTCAERVARSVRFRAARRATHAFTRVLTVPSKNAQPATQGQEDELVLRNAEDRLERCVARSAPDSSRLVRTVELDLRIAADGRVAQATAYLDADESTCVENVCRSLQFRALDSDRWWTGRVDLWARAPSGVE